jgi:membrane associated rhomboid family serine protease
MNRRVSPVKYETIMTETDDSPLVAILRHCAAAAPEPWYPSVYARDTGINRDSLDPHLDRLRLDELIQLTDWVEGKNQGYRLTPEGQRVLQTPRDLKLLQEGKLPGRRPAAESPQPATERMTTFERGEVVRTVLEGPGPAPVTMALLLANIAVFLYGLVLAGNEGLTLAYYFGFADTAPDAKELWAIQHRIGGLSGRDILLGEWWKLLTSCFVHLGLPHLAVNMVTLYVIGRMVEQIWGHWRFLYIYIVAGLGGSCAMVLVNPHGAGAGASGALWGIMAAEVTWMLVNRQHLPAALMSAWLRSRLSIFMINVFISMLPYISAAAHFGGGFVGILAALLVNQERFSSGVRRWLALLGMGLLPVLCVVAVQWQGRAEQRELEFRDFDGRISESDKKVLDDPLVVYDKLLKGLIEQQSAAQRNPKTVEQALALIAAQQHALEQVGERLGAGDEYTARVIIEAHLAGIQVITLSRDFFRLAARCLQPGTDGPQLLKALLEQRKKVDDNVQAWKECWEDFRRSYQRLQGIGQ